MENKIALVLGVGAENGIGGAICKKMASKDYHVIVVGRTISKLNFLVDTIRTLGGKATPLTADLSIESEIISVFEEVDAINGRLSFVTFNAGNAFRSETLKMTAEFFEEAWRICCLGGFVSGREATKRLCDFGQGTIIFTGATASIKARPPFLAFSSAKFGLRAVASGLAREFGPKGIHIAHAIIDGGVEGEIIRNRAPERIKAAGENGMLNPCEIANTYWQLHCQHPSAWSFEIDLRPYKEVF